MNRPAVGAILTSLLLTPLSVKSQVPQILNYQGRVIVDGTNFSGTGVFRFALVNGIGGATCWSNGNSVVSLPVSAGLYSVLLGDTTVTNMAPISATVFTNADVRLRVWFDGGMGLQQLIPDRRLSAAGYALMAGTVPDGAITSNKLAAGAVTAVAIADGVLGGVTANGMTNLVQGSTNDAAQATFRSLLHSGLAGTSAATNANTNPTFFEDESGNVLELLARPEPGATSHAQVNSWRANAANTTNWAAGSGFDTTHTPVPIFVFGFHGFSLDMVNHSGIGGVNDDINVRMSDGALGFGNSGQYSGGYTFTQKPLIYRPTMFIAASTNGGLQIAPEQSNFTDLQVGRFLIIQDMARNSATLDNGASDEITFAVRRQSFSTWITNVVMTISNGALRIVAPATMTSAVTLDSTLNVHGVMTGDARGLTNLPSALATRTAESGTVFNHSLTGTTAGVVFRYTSISVNQTNTLVATNAPAFLSIFVPPSTVTNRFIFKVPAGSSLFSHSRTNSLASSNKWLEIHATWPDVTNVFIKAEELL